jgi:hypothetical protein
MILIDKHNRLGVKTCDFMCLKDWFDVEQRNQHSPIGAPSSGEFMTDADEDSDSIPENDL